MYERVMPCKNRHVLPLSLPHACPSWNVRRPKRKPPAVDSIPSPASLGCPATAGAVTAAVARVHRSQVAAVGVA